jgi:membrane-associated phospholipid phosphatase
VALIDAGTAGGRDDGYHLIDIAMLAYQVPATIAVLLSFRSDAAPWGRGWLIAAHALLLLLVTLAPRARRAGPVGRIVGDWYPMLTLPALYTEVGVLTLNAGLQNDWSIQRLETWVFGSEVSYRWIREMPSVGLSWVLHSCYLLYYAVLYGSPIVLWLSGRRDQARYTILALMLAFYFCYVVFLFFPVAGPRYAFDLPDNAAAHVWPARAAHWLLDRGDSWGSAFPSSHVAGAAVATGMALRYWRSFGLTLLPVAVGLVIAVVYGQFHYAVDAVTGLLVAGVTLAVMEWLRKRRAVQPAVAVVGVLEVSR